MGKRGNGYGDFVATVEVDSPRQAFQDSVKSDLEKRVEALERAGSYRIKMSGADLLRLQSGDVVILRLPRSLADSETKRLVEGWKDLMRSIGHEGDVQLMVLAGVDCEIGVIRDGPDR